VSPVQLMIRNAVPDDGAAVAVLLAELGYPISVEEARARIERAVERILLAVEDGQIVGLLAIFARVPLSMDAPIARITAMVVRSTHRRRGVGRRLPIHSKVDGHDHASA
jgi:N-acetylglutamate synthase-like GNAT family acetyltransferase